MKESDKRIELLGSAPISKALLSMGLPTMIGMMITALYNLVDAYFVVDLEQVKWELYPLHFH